MSGTFEVQWRLGKTTVYGTCVIPPGRGPFPAVVMVAGSGPTDRDWNSPLFPGTHGGGRLLAEALAEMGVASVRYDKRVAGPHASENMRELAGSLTMESHREEFQAAVEFLAGRPDIAADAIVGLGHSEGAIHVLHYQLQSPPVPLRGLILAAPPGRPVGVVARAQLASQLAGQPEGPRWLGFYDEAITRFQAGEPASPDASLPPEVKQLIATLESPANLPFSRELWEADVARLLAAITVPTLVIIGKKDIQVDWQVDGEILAQAAGDMSHITWHFPDNANHVLKYEPQDRDRLSAAAVAVRYNAEDGVLDRETLTMIRNWLRNLWREFEGRKGLG
ncbi:MAG: alpha/beta hydrolase [Firmicutes bacterium]|nr:alpha/beta hydrolase [Bacillota bacterium]